MKGMRRDNGRKMNQISKNAVKAINRHPWWAEAPASSPVHDKNHLFCQL